MDNWRSIAVSPQATLLEVMNVIDKGVKQIALVIADDDHLIGTVTDGDIRRAILKGHPLDANIQHCINTNPITGLMGESPATLQRLMQKKSLKILPILNSNGQVVDIRQVSFPAEKIKENKVVIMAGGLGSRLHPLTKNSPKPLLKVGKRPILETIINNFIDQGFYKFVISINYQGDKIKHFFKHLEQQIEVEYIEEKQRLGTAGALGLFAQRPEQPFIVINGDILTTLDFNRLISFHKKKRNSLTMCVREYSFQVPYGVIKQDEHVIKEIQEKPRQFFQVNSGIYVLNPEIITKIPNNTYTDMPELINQLLDEELKVGAFPLTDYWLDIGRMEDFEKAHDEFYDIFEE